MNYDRYPMNIEIEDYFYVREEYEIYADRYHTSETF